MRILIIEPYDTGSHGVWMRGYRTFSQHEVHLLTLEGQFWQWRLVGGAVALAEQYLTLDFTPDLIVASDMLDLGKFLALTRPVTSQIPIALYFHENQLTYPTGPRQKRHHHYAYINYASALVADAVYFNSAFHRDSFFNALPRLLKHFPDYNSLHTIPQIKERSDVLPVGLDLERYDPYRPKSETPRDPGQPPLVLWNHRWEFDKNPEPFFKALARLAAEDVPFRVALVGENQRQEPTEFEAARDLLGERVAQYGYLDSFADYARLLWDSDIIASSAKHDFFGISVVEAIYCGCWPVLPWRLNYPDLIPASQHENTLYRADSGLYFRLRERLLNPTPAPPELREFVRQFDWRQLAPRYDAAFEAVASGRAITPDS